MRPRVLRRRMVLAGFGTLLAGSLIGAGVAKADANDDLFLTVLDNQGITYPSQAYVINAGHTVCEHRSLGYSEIQTAMAVLTNSSLTARNSGFFVGAAELAYCPWFYGGGTVVRA